MNLRRAAIVLAAALAAPAWAAPTLVDTRHALDVGRLDQARDMIGTMIAAGAHGPAIERLLADLALARGENGQALAHYRWLLGQRPDDGALLEAAGIAALRGDDLATGTAYLARATAPGVNGADWRAWNALGVAADRRGNFTAAAVAYADAAVRAGTGPGAATIANNRGWSLMLQGHWAEAARQFDQAFAAASKLPHLAANRELAAAALAADLPQRRDSEDDAAFAARLNDAGVVAAAGGDRTRAAAAFARAIEARRQWDQRAAANLAALGPAKP